MPRAYKSDGAAIKSSEWHVLTISKACCASARHYIVTTDNSVLNMGVRCRWWWCNWLRIPKHQSRRSIICEHEEYLFGYLNTFKGNIVVYRAPILGEDQLGRKEKAHIYVADVAQMTWVTTGHDYLEWEETCPSRCDLEWEENCPIRSENLEWEVTYLSRLGQWVRVIHDPIEEIWLYQSHIATSSVTTLKNNYHGGAILASHGTSEKESGHKSTRNSGNLPDTQMETCQKWWPGSI